MAKGGDICFSSIFPFAVFLLGKRGRENLTLYMVQLSIAGNSGGNKYERQERELLMFEPSSLASAVSEIIQYLTVPIE